MKKKMLCVTNVELEELGGRPYAIKTRLKHIEKYGWDVEFFVLKHYYESIGKLWSFKKELVKKKINIVWSMNNPFTLHLPPLFLKKLGVDFIWIAEFRDPIYLNPDPKKIKLIYKLVDSEILRKADAVIIPKGMQADTMDYSREYNMESNKFFSLPYAGIENERCSGIEYNSRLPFTITYAGSFYRGWIEPVTFLKGFRIFTTKNELTHNTVNVNFFGDWSEEYTTFVKKLGIEEYIRVWGWVERSRLSSYLANSHVFVHIAGSVPSNRKNVSYKIWDYLCHAKPILALCGENYVLREFIIKNKFGYVANYNDPEDIAKKLDRAYADFESGDAKKLIKKLLKNRLKFDRKYHDEAFARICDIVYEKHLRKHQN